MIKDNDYPALLLNADGRPMRYAPLSTVCWKEAVTKVMNDAYAVMAEYDQVVRSPSTEFRLPSVVMIRSFVNRAYLPVPLTRMGLMLVSNYRCAYCGERFAGRTELLTFEHVIPRARGGETEWENILLACGGCNQRKACRTPAEAGMRPLWQPWRPGRLEMDRLMSEHQREVRGLHASWIDFLYWDSDLTG